MMIIKDTELLNIDHNGQIYHGADQAWYKTKWQRDAGCGPTVCSNILLYYAKNKGLDIQIDGCSCNNQDFPFKLMEKIWEFITPGKLGVNSTRMFRGGLLEFASIHDLSFDVKTLDVPKDRKDRPSIEEVNEFITKSIESNNPVAFLNLSNGNQNHLENWHWVLIIGIDGHDATIFDQGKCINVDLAQWIETSRMGGGFVSVSI